MGNIRNLVLGLVLVSLAGCNSAYVYDREQALAEMAASDFDISSSKMVNYAIDCAAFGFTEESWNWQNCIASRAVKDAVDAERRRWQEAQEYNQVWAAYERL